MSWVTKEELDKFNVYYIFGVYISSKHKNVKEITDQIVSEQGFYESRLWYYQRRIEKLNPDLVYRKYDDCDIVRYLKFEKTKRKKRIKYLNTFDTDFSLQDLCLMKITKEELKMTYLHDFLIKRYINLNYYKECLYYSGSDITSEFIRQNYSEYGAFGKKYESGLRAAMVANFIKNRNTENLSRDFSFYYKTTLELKKKNLKSIQNDQHTKNDWILDDNFTSLICKTKLSI